MRLQLPDIMSGKSGMSGRPPTTARHINAFSCPTWLSLCRAHVGHVGRARLHGDIRRDGWKGMGRMRPVGGMGRCAPHRTAFPLAAGLSGRPRPACGLHTGQVRRLGCVGASTLNRHVFEVARHHVKGTTKTPQGQELNLHTADINTPAPLPNRGTLAGDL